MSYKRIKNPFKEDKVKCCECRKISTSYYLGKPYCQEHNPKNLRKELYHKRVTLNKEFRKRYGDDWRNHLGRQLKRNLSSKVLTELYKEFL